MNDLPLQMNILLKMMRKVIKVLLRGEKKGQSMESGEKKKGDKEIFNKERDNEDAINQVSI